MDGTRIAETPQRRWTVLITEKISFQARKQEKVIGVNPPPRKEIVKKIESVFCRQEYVFVVTFQSFYSIMLCRYLLVHLGLVIDVKLTSKTVD